MAKKRITRKELLKKDDEFISFSARTFQFVSSHRNKIEYTAICVGVIIIILLGVNLYFRHLNKRALAAYNLAYRNLVFDSLPDDTEDNTKKSIEELDNIIQKFGRTRISSLAIPQLAYLKFGQGKYDEAISLYMTYLKKDTSSSIYKSMAHFGIAASYEAKGDYQPAIDHLKKIIDGNTIFLKEEALFALGRVYAMSGQRELSKNTFKQFVDQFHQSPLLPLAKSYLKQ
jgi:tetratricopeptide (TPR) repeat protein